MDGNNWIDIIGETDFMYSVTGISTTMYYRVKVAEDAINLSNPLCNSLSEIFDILIVPQPAAPMSNGDVINCENETEGASVAVTGNNGVDWYDSAIGGNLLMSNSITYTTTVAGTYYAETITNSGSCGSNTRTAVSVNFFDSPQVTDEELSFCFGEEIVLDAGIDHVTYLWSTGEDTRQITVAAPATYSVEVTNTDMCSSVKTVLVTEDMVPVIDSIVSDGSSIIINTTNSGEFEYSLDGYTYQDYPVFESVKGGMYLVRVSNECGIATQEYIHIVYPLYFTPNNDQYHDYWNIEGIQTFPSASIFIYDRFGKLLKQLSPNEEGWNGTYLGRNLPSSEYWFSVDMHNGAAKVTGHFSLIR